MKKVAKMLFYPLDWQKFKRAAISSNLNVRLYFIPIYLKGTNILGNIQGAVYCGPAYSGRKS